MTSSIGSLPGGQTASEAAAQAQASGTSQSKPVEPVAALDAVTQAAGGAQASEAVTLSADGQSTAQLLDAARGADGVDSQKVEQLRQAVQSGSYGPTPEDVAKAISSAFGGGAITGPPG